MKRLMVLVLVLTGITTGAGQLRADDVADLAATIDQRISARWEAENVVPAPETDDAEFLRRVYLHLTGKIPRVSEVRAFLDNPSANKRRELVDELLESPAYIVNFTSVWRSLMIPDAEADRQLANDITAFEAWLREQLTHDVRFDVMVRELFILPRSMPNNNNFTPGTPVEPSPLAYLRSKQNKPEVVAAQVSRLFLGVRLECAQCHDHPFARWQQKDFWQFAAVFNPTMPAVEIPETKQMVKAAYLNDEDAKRPPGTTIRDHFGDWLTSRENPYFARAAVNRMWYHLFGTGLVDPVDDFDENNPPSHPELLDELAEAFAAHDFDIKFLLRSIVASRAYQLTSRQTDDSQSDPRLYAKMAIQGLTTEQLFDSLAEATGFFESNADRNPLNINDSSERAKFRQLFGNEAGGPVDAETTILQALALMNGEFVESATDLEQSTTLTAVAESPFLDTPERIRTLFLASLSRYPSGPELERMVAYVDLGGSTDDSKTALGDVFWALLNSSEFILNH
ncbi:DUF1549 and DUF1553 domain-containing protein [Symmachiella dynata]|uniref:DUF1549 and DUF1553 domain-containing protein n=1 Tax=Symmachiella dynata TaxID=2527995 RepID=UPI0030EF155C